MSSTLLILLLPALLLIVAFALVLVWDRLQKKKPTPEAGEGEPEGSFRAFYHALWLLALWCVVALSFPLWISYRELVQSVPGERWHVMARVLVFPAVLFALFLYGSRRKYVKWIESLEWPDEENK